MIDNCSNNSLYAKHYFHAVSGYDVTFLFTLHASLLRKKEFLIVIDLKSSGTLVNVKIDDFTIELIFCFSIRKKLHG